ncbi:NADH-quinone oxidoreductase subunit M [Gammaproteobacteria bacterium]|nr:NADH-quinone oxidoreductase subunit M [Gammaproteobacteria bacterium]MDB2444546.1 NADH-quinone oxidoreductase subunit M [Gammaproteobacteria bacterium]
MILLSLVGVFFFGGLLAWVSEIMDARLPRWVAMLTILVSFSLVFRLIFMLDSSGGDLLGWVDEFKDPWIPSLGIDFFFAADGLTVLMLGLTILLGAVAIASAWDEIKERAGFFYFNLLWTLAGVVGVFTALDLFLFFFFWEVMLIPMYFIIAIWGHENRRYAATKFFIFTQVTGMMMLVSLLCMVYFHSLQFGSFSFNYNDLLRVDIPRSLDLWIMLGFFAAFATKLPSVPFHSWLPDAHSQAPTAGSVLLAGVLLKTGAYGLIRFTIPLFPEASEIFAPVAMFLAVVSILYCAKVALAQTDIKRLIAYTSVSHMGFVLLGIYAWNELGLQGAIMTMLAHGLSAAALFMLAGGLQHRIHTRDMREMSGFWIIAPKMAVVALFFSVAALGLPGLGNFVGEFLALLGAFSVNIPAAVLAAFGVIFASVYSLWVMQSVFQGPPLKQESKASSHETLLDLDGRELFFYGVMMIGLLWMGLYPQTFLDFSSGVIEGLVISDSAAALYAGEFLK